MPSDMRQAGCRIPRGVVSCQRAAVRVDAHLLAELGLVGGWRLVIWNVCFERGGCFTNGAHRVPNLAIDQAREALDQHDPATLRRGQPASFQELACNGFDVLTDHD
jgi:hypothetical protein